MELMKYLKTYKLFESEEEDEEIYSPIIFPDFSELTFDIDSNYDDIDISVFEFFDYPNNKCYDIEFTKNNDYNYGEFNKEKESWICSLSEYIHEQEDIDELYNAILKGCLKNLGNHKIDSMLEQIEERMKYNERKNEKIKEFMRLKDDMENSVEYQAYLLKKGDIPRLMRIKNLKPVISNKLKDVKKQTEWS